MRYSLCVYRLDSDNKIMRYPAGANRGSIQSIVTYGFPCYEHKDGFCREILTLNLSDVYSALLSLGAMYGPKYRLIFGEEGVRGDEKLQQSHRRLVDYFFPYEGEVSVDVDTLVVTLDRLANPSVISSYLFCVVFLKSVLNKGEWTPRDLVSEAINVDTAMSPIQQYLTAFFINALFTNSNIANRDSYYISGNGPGQECLSHLPGIFHSLGQFYMDYREESDRFIKNHNNDYILRSFVPEFERLAMKGIIHDYKKVA